MEAIKHTGVVAIWNEIDPLLEVVDIQKTSEYLQARFHHGSYAGQKVTLAEVGMGKVQAAAACQHLIDVHGVDLLVSCGSAGAIDPRLEIGDVVLADRVVPHDFGVYNKQDFIYLGVVDNRSYDGMHYHRHLSPDPAILEKAQSIATSLEWPDAPTRVHTGCLVSGDQVIASGEKKRWLSDNFDALAVEMEAGAVAHTAVLNGLPWLAVRAVSDKADHSTDIDYASMVIYSDEESGLLAKARKRISSFAEVATDPAQLKAILELQKGLKVAAKNAAFVVTAIIKEI
jgi:adenosylhomocysteine nucleosidase